MKHILTLLLLVLFTFTAYGQSKSQLLRKAQAGDANAQYQVGDYYYHGYSYGGLDFEKDYREAAKWLLKAAEQGHAIAQHLLSFCYKFGDGVAKDYDEAEKWLRKSAAQGYDLAYHSLGNFLRVCRKDYPGAIYWFKKAVDEYYRTSGLEDKGSLLELRELGVEYHPRQQSSTAKNNVAVNRKKTANPNNPTDPKAQYDLALRCLYEYLDEEKAFFWFSKSANQGFAEAQLALATCYAEGRGIDEADENKAFYWFSKSAEQGNAEAQYYLGNCYEYGIGTEENEKMAIRWYEQAGLNGNTDAMESLLDPLFEKGKQYYLYWGKKLLYTLQKKAEAGAGEAQDALGRYYYNGNEFVTEIDYAQAAYWLEQAVVSRYDDSSTFSILSEIYSEGKGVKKDAAKAKRFGDKAREKAYEESLKMFFPF